MKVIIVALALVAVALAAEVPVPQVLRSNNDQTPDGGYNFGFETEDGIQRQETGEVKEVLDEDKKPHQVVFVRGSYSYTDKDGHVETVNYIADDKGFQPDGPSIPKVSANSR